MMRAKKAGILDELRTALNSISKKKSEIIFPVLSDALFPIIYGIVNSYFGIKVLFYLYSLGQAMIDADVSSVTPFAWKAFLNLAGFIVMLYLTYVIFQGISWMFSRIFSGDRISFKDYMKGFALVNILWYSVFVAYTAALFMLDYYEVMSWAVRTALHIMMAACFYFACISYTMIGSKRIIRKSLREGTERFMHLAPRFFACAALIYIINNGLIYAGLVSRTLIIVMGVFIFLPFITFLRVYFHIAVKNRA